MSYHHEEEDDDALYGGFNDSSNDATAFQQAQPPQTQSRRATALHQPAAAARPMTSSAGTGFVSQRQGQFNALQAGVAPKLQKLEVTPEEELRAQEKEIVELLEGSVVKGTSGDFKSAVEMAKEAAKKDRTLLRDRDRLSLSDAANVDLSTAVLFNLADQYTEAGHYAEALSTYTTLLNSKQYSHPGRLRVNMGNIYIAQGKVSMGVKMYRMALDKIPTTFKETRNRILRNIGNALVKSGQFSDAVESYESVMSSTPDFRTGFNLVLCYYALGDAANTRYALNRLVSIKNADVVPEEEANDTTVSDELKKEIQSRHRRAERYIMQACKLCAPLLAENESGEVFDAALEVVQRSPYSYLTAELEIAKALAFIKKKNFPKAMQVLNSFERKGAGMMASAACNLSFLHFVEGRVTQAMHYAEQAVESDPYNAKALVNLANCFYSKKEYQKAKELYFRAIRAESDCSEALHNLGLCCIRLGDYHEAAAHLHALNKLVPNQPEVISQLASLAEMAEDFDQVHDLLQVLVTLVPADSRVLARLGQTAHDAGDESQAYQSYSESFRLFPADLDVVSWMGAYFVRNEAYEQAIPYFNMAAQVERTEAKWRMMAASCYRRIGDTARAIQTYRETFKEFPENMECLKYLIQLCGDAGLVNDVTKYTQIKKRLEKTQAAVAPGTPPQQASGHRRESPQSPQDSWSPGANGQHQIRRPIESDSPQKPQLPDWQSAAARGEEDLNPVTQAGGRMRSDLNDWSDDDHVDNLLP